MVFRIIEKMAVEPAIAPRRFSSPGPSVSSRAFRACEEAWSFCRSGTPRGSNRKARRLSVAETRPSANGAYGGYRNRDKCGVSFRTRDEKPGRLTTYKPFHAHAKDVCGMLHSATKQMWMTRRFVDLLRTFPIQTMVKLIFSPAAVSVLDGRGPQRLRPVSLTR